jgi:hypothetical protein
VKVANAKENLKSRPKEKRPVKKVLVKREPVREAGRRSENRIIFSETIVISN